MTKKTKLKGIVIGAGIILAIVFIFEFINSIHTVNLLQSQIEGKEEEYKNNIQQLTAAQEVQLKELNERINRSAFLDLAPTARMLKSISYQVNYGRYHDENYNCVDFSHELIQEYYNKGIYSCMTILYLKNGGAHSIVAVNTSTDGIVYVEPQDNTLIYSLNVGDDYCDVANWNCNWEITHIKTCFDDLQ